MAGLSEKILVALSGGVDSAVSAALLVDQGHEVEAIYVRTWEHENDLLGDCPGAKDLKDAKRIAEHLGIPFQVLNLVDFYRREVVQPMIRGYASGITPNPDILCNRNMKFGTLLDFAMRQGFDALATGHYCRRLIGCDGNAQLWEGMDKTKDQSYFLARLSRDQLEKVRFPLGEITKLEVRKLALKWNLHVANKKDSQGICFLGKVKIPDFLSNFIDDNPGEIVTKNGQVLGQHRGLHKYTLGQRRGIGIPSNQDHENYVVTGKNEDRNQLIVAFEHPSESTLWSRRFRVESLSFLNFDTPIEPIRVLGRARYRDPSTKLELIPQMNENAEIFFDLPQRALTPGQILALYEGERLIGSAYYSKSAFGRASLSA